MVACFCNIRHHLPLSIYASASKPWMSASRAEYSRDDVALAYRLPVVEIASCTNIKDVTFEEALYLFQSLLVTLFNCRKQCLSMIDADYISNEQHSHGIFRRFQNSLKSK